MAGRPFALCACALLVAALLSAVFGIPLTVRQPAGEELFQPFPQTPAALHHGESSLAGIPAAIVHETAGQQQQVARSHHRLPLFLSVLLVAVAALPVLHTFFSIPILSPQKASPLAIRLGGNAPPCPAA